MANLSHYGSDNLAEVNNLNNMSTHLDHQEMQVSSTSKQSTILAQSNTESTSDSNIISYSKYMNESQYNTVQNSTLPASQDDLILSVIEQLKTQVVNCTRINQDNKQVNELLTAKLKSTHKVAKELWERIQMLMQGTSLTKQERECKLYNEFEKFAYRKGETLRDFYLRFSLILNDMNMYNMKLEQFQTELSVEQAFWSWYSVNSEEPNLSSSTTIVEVLKEPPKVTMVNSSLKKLKFYLASFDVVVKERTTATAIMEGTWGFEHIKACFRDEIIPFVKALKDLFNWFDKLLIDELTKVQNVFNQMEQTVEQHCVAKNDFQDKMNDVFKKNKRLLEQAISADIVNIVVHANVNYACKTVNKCERCVIIETELQRDFIKRECSQRHLKKNKGKAVVNKAVPLHSIDPELLKIDVAPLAPKLRNNRTAHNDYLKHTQEETATLRELVENERLLNPLNTSLDYAYTKAISSVPNSKLNVNSDLKCATCNGCLFSDNHDSCVLAYINFANARVKSISVKKPVNRKIWQPTGKMFTTIRHICRPTGRSFTLVGNECPLTRITTTAIVPLREPIPIVNNTDKPIVTLVYSRKSKAAKKKVPVSNSKINKSLVANEKEPNNSWGSTISNVPSLIIECRVYFVEGLGHNLFSVGQFCDSDLEVAFRQHTYFIRNLDGVDLLTGSRGNNLYTLSLKDMMAALCYPTNDSENLGKLQPKADIEIFIGYAPTKKAFRIYNRRTRRIVKTIHVDFDELTAMASEHSS
nr:integrase, catalytic region, zinc finger, CCHC-type, peptidase aspartic, catalytic [Tanacetum cinerariifolium]